MLRFGQLLKGFGGICNNVSQTVRGGSYFPYGQNFSPYSQSLGRTSSLLNTPLPLNPFTGLLTRCKASLAWMHKHGGKWIKKRPSKNPLGYNVPFAKGVVIRPIIRKPKKPNSANRKCVLVRLSNGKETVAYVPKEGHNLQEHNIVLVRVGRLKDCPGVKLKCVRGKYDLPHPEKRAPTL